MHKRRRISSKTIISSILLTYASCLFPKTTEEKAVNQAFYEDFVDSLQQENKTVQQYIKEQHNKAKEDIFSQLSQDPTKIIKAQKVLRKTHKSAKKPLIIIDEEERLTVQQKRELRNLAKKCKVQGFLSVTPFTGAYSQLEPLPLGQEVIQRLYLPSDFFQNKQRFSEDQIAIILHEFTHLKKLHACEKKLVEKSSEVKTLKDLNHFYEYQADQYYASKNLTLAYALEKKFSRKEHQKSIERNCNSFTHPPTLQRYKAIKSIRKLKEAEEKIITTTFSYLSNPFLD